MGAIGAGGGGGGGGAGAGAHAARNAGSTMATSAALRNCLRRANFSAISDIRFPPRLRESHNTAIVKRLTASNNVSEMLLVPARAQNAL